MEELERLIVDPDETETVEYKRWLDLHSKGQNSDPAKLAKALIALRNSGGGHVVIGFNDEKGQPLKALPRPDNYEAFDSDRIQSIIRRYAEPQFQCRLHEVRGHPVIAVLADVSEPVIARAGSPDQETLINGRYYVRVPGPESREPQNAREWKALIDRCVANNRDAIVQTIIPVIRQLAELQVVEISGEETAVSRIEGLLDDSLQEALARGYYGADYKLNASVDSLGDLRKCMQTADQPRYTGWPPFIWLDREPDRPVVYDQHTYRCTIIAENLFRPHYERWSAATTGNFTIVRAHELDHVQEYAALHAIGLTLPVWRTAELMLHAGRLAKEFSASKVEFTIMFTGLKGRELVTLPESSRYLSPGHRTGAAEYERTITLDADSIDAGVVSFTDRLLRPFFELFELILPAELCEQEIGKMRANRF